MIRLPPGPPLFPTRRSSDLHDISVVRHVSNDLVVMYLGRVVETGPTQHVIANPAHPYTQAMTCWVGPVSRSEEHTSELQSHSELVCRLLLEKKKKRDGGLTE